MDKLFKKLIVGILTLSLVLSFSSSVVFAGQTSETQTTSKQGENGGDIISKTLDELIEAGDLDAEVIVAENLSSNEEALEFVGEQSDDVLCHIEIECNMNSDGIGAYAVVVCAKNLWERNDESEISALSDETLIEHLQKAWGNLEETIYVYNFGLTVSNLTEMYFSAILQSPEFFNVETSYRYSYYESGAIYYVLPDYIETDLDKYTDMLNNFNNKVQEAKEAVAESGATTELGKTYVLHNWLCGNTTYNYSAAESSEVNDWTNFTAYGTLVNGTGVCQSYTLAFATILRDNGIDAKCLIVNSMDHAWNEVKIGNCWYQTDVTWDDTDDEDINIYSWFLKSDDAFTKHNGWKNGAYAEYPSYGWDESLTCASTIYDSKDWENFDPKTPCPDGHTVVTDSSVQATCTETGLTEGSHCQICGEILTAQETIPAKGHTKETVKGKEATCTEAGLTDGTKCSVCGEVLTAQNTIPAKGHTWDDGTVTTEATCTKAGEKTYTCTACGDTKTEEIDATGHKEAGAVKENEKAATYTSEGSYDKVVYCSICKEELSRETVKTAKLSKLTNPMTLKASSKTLKYKTLKKKKQSFTITFKTKAQGKVTYTLNSKAKKAGIKVSSIGKVTVPKKCKKGTYKITVKAAGNTQYNALNKTFTIKVK